MAPKGETERLFEAVERRLKHRRTIVSEPVKEACVAVLADEIMAFKNRIADLIGSLVDLYGELDSDQLETLAELVRNHTYDENGSLVPRHD